MPQRTVEGWVRRKEMTQSSPSFSREKADEYIALRRELVRALHEAGAGILLASDAPQLWNVPGFSLQHEMRLMAEAGLTPYQILETGTKNPARYFGTDERGMIREGAIADLVLLEADPLADIANTAQLAGVVLRGRWLAKAEIEARPAGIVSEVRGWPPTASYCPTTAAPPPLGSSRSVPSRSIVSSVPGSGQRVKSRSLEKIITPI